MIVVGMACVWLSYATGLWGYCLARGHKVSFMEMVIPSEWPGWSAITASSYATGKAASDDLTKAAKDTVGSGTGVTPVGKAVGKVGEKVTGSGTGVTPIGKRIIKDLGL